MKSRKSTSARWLAAAVAGTVASIHSSQRASATTAILESSLNNSAIQSFNLSTGASLGTFTTIANPGGIAVGSDGNVYIDNGPRNIDRYSSNGTHVGLFASPSELGDSLGMAFDSTGNLYIGDGFAPGKIVKVNSTGTDLGTIATPPEGVWPIAVDSSNNLYAGQEGGTVMKYTSSGGSLGTFATITYNSGLGFEANDVYGLAFDASHDLFVSTHNPSGGGANGYITEYNSSGTVINSFTTNFFNGGIVVGPSGIIYVTGDALDNSDNFIEKFTASGTDLGMFADLGSSETTFLAIANVGTGSIGQWTNANHNSAWNDAGNWNPSGIVSGQSAVANFNGADVGTPGAGIVNLGVAQTVGKINFSGTSVLYAIQAGGGSLIIDDGVDADPSINVTNGVQAINAPISMASGLFVTFQGGSLLNIGGAISGPGTLAVSGTGAMIVSTTGTLPSGPLSISSSAQVALLAAAAPSAPHIQSIGSLAIDASSRLDISNNEVRIANATAASIENQLVPGYNNGHWNGTHGIISSTAQADIRHGVGFAPFGPSGIELRYAFLGDTDLSGSVNFSDLLTLAQHYGQSGQFWYTGDTNYDGSINFTDLLNLAQNYGQSLPINSSDFSPSFVADWNLAVSEASAVPEPASVGMAAIAMTGLLARRRQR